MSNAEYDDLSAVFSRGDVTTLNKKQLERFLVLLSRPNASTRFPGSLYPQACDAVRLMLTVRMSEEQNLQAQKESRLALIIACVALLAGIVQAAVSYLQFVSSSPIQVTANNPLPVRTVEAIPVYAVQNAQVQKKPVTVKQVPQK